MSSEPPFFHRIISNAWKGLAIPRSQDEGNHLLSSPSSVTRIRSFTLTLPQNHGSDRLPLYHVNATEIQKLDYHPNPNPKPKTPLNLSLKIVCMTFAALGYQTMSTSQYQPSILGLAMMVAFAASLSAIFIKSSYPRLAAIVAIIGYLSFTLSFLVMTKVFFTGNLILWGIIGGLAMVWIIIALLIRFFAWSLSVGVIKSPN